MACCADPFKAMLHGSTHAVLKLAVAAPKKAPPILQLGQLDKKRFIVAFCGSGTGHLTQALAVIQLQQKRGLTLAGVVTDTDASPKMLEEMIKPLGVEVLILPAIKLVDTVKGMVPIPLVLVAIVQVQQKLKERAADIAGFLERTRPGLLLSFWHITFCFFLQNFARPPPEMKVVHVAAQFALCKELAISDLNNPLEVVTMATADVMASIFRSTGVEVPISPTESPTSLSPILEVPPAVSPNAKKLILCYFLVRSDALQLEKILASQMSDPTKLTDSYSFGDVEFHCFTANPLDTPTNRPLALHSHQKQRALFQQLFARCTGIICSSGNETVWESVCRGVPVLTMPTTGHGEQLLNARVHARNFPHLVRAAESVGFLTPGGRLSLTDVQWIVGFEQTAESKEESKKLRDHVSGLASRMAKGGVPMLAPPA